ncbi:hypothetical protein H9Q74_011535 [Fusarium xylarioides]|nr:hypothetical protein H9Q71_011956 [Fusarium xylarioides]KAG5815733.1 hypothetical protein H9Q74_011535 [Fusarium xylarioides]
MGTKCEEPINIRINALRIVDDSPVNPRSELQDAIGDFNQAVASAQLCGARFVALLNDPDVVYKASEEELFKIITLCTVPRECHVDGLLEQLKAKIDEIARATLDKIDDRLESEWRIVEECYNQARHPSGSLDPDFYCMQQVKVEHYWMYQPNNSE